MSDANKFEENPGESSMMRYGFFVLLWAAVGLTILGVLAYFGIMIAAKWFPSITVSGSDILDALFPYVVAFLIIGFSGKTVQKLIENFPNILESLTKLKGLS